MDFNMMFLTPIDFLDFYIGVWNSCLPNDNCKNCPMNSKLDKMAFISKIKVYANQLLNKYVSDLCGHSISIKYLPSTVAISALQMAQKLILAQEGLQNTTE